MQVPELKSKTKHLLRWLGKDEEPAIETMEVHLREEQGSREEWVSNWAFPVNTLGSHAALTDLCQAGGSHTPKQVCEVFILLKARHLQDSLLW